MKLKKVGYFVSSLLIVGGILVACGEEPKPVSTTDDSSAEETVEEVRTEFNIGEKIQLGDAVLTVTNVEKSKGNDWDYPQQGKEFVIVHVEIENAGDTNSVYYTPLDFTMQNSNGQVTDITFTTVDANTALGSGELIPGGKVVGTVTFEQPIGDENLILLYSPNFWSDSKIKVKLQ